jgi:hypothetical protein
MNKNSKYAIIEFPGALSFNSISKEISKDGINLTPARIRLILLHSLEKIVRKISFKYQIPIGQKRAEEIVKEIDFQNTIAPLIQMAYEE